MNHRRKIDEDLWEDGDEKISADHVVERFFAQHEREAAEPARHPGPPRPKRRAPGASEAEE